MKLDHRWLQDTVRARFDSDEAMEAFLPRPLGAQQLRQMGDDRYLSGMTRRVFQAGMQHSVVDAKWPGFEAVFGGFDPQALAQAGPAQVDGWMADARIIRHRVKLQSIAVNARLILDVQRDSGGSFGALIADWPTTDIVGLWRFLGARGGRLGGRSAAGFLRLMGKDTFLLTSDVVARLKQAGVIEREPTGQRDLQRVQDALNALQQASGRSLCQLSAMLALSIHPMF